MCYECEDDPWIFCTTECILSDTRLNPLSSEPLSEQNLRLFKYYSKFDLPSSSTAKNATSTTGSSSSSSAATTTAVEPQYFAGLLLPIMFTASHLQALHHRENENETDVVLGDGFTVHPLGGKSYTYAYTCAYA